MKRPTKQVEKICEGIGGELAHDLDALAVHLPQMLLSPSSRVFIVAGAIGRDTDDPQRAWEIICKEVLAPAHNEKIFTFPGAFLAGLQGKNHKLVEKWLDDALAFAVVVPILDKYADFSRHRCTRMRASH